MRVFGESLGSVAPMDRSPRWRKPAGRLDQPARPRRVLAVIRVLVLLTAPGRPLPETPPPDGGPPAGGGGEARPGRPGRPGLVDFLVAWFGGVGRPGGAQGALGGGRHGGMQPTCSATRNGASVVSPIRCRRLRAAIGAQRKAH